MYLVMALFWVVVAVVLQIYWEPLSRHAFIPIDRSIIGFACFALFSYNFIRWRMARAREKWQEEAGPPPPRPRRVDPTFDFSDAKPADDTKKDPPPP